MQDVQNNDPMQYLYEVFELMHRGGPGDTESTLAALAFCKDLPQSPKMLDIGCGPGKQSVDLARAINSNIIALDNHQPFLDTLVNNAKHAGVSALITIKNQSMLEMDFPDESFDLIWSEGALYFLGFAEGLKKCRSLLKNKGYIAVTEPVYLKQDIPQEVNDFWDPQYPAISDISSKLEVIKSQGLEVVGHFTLPKEPWCEFYDDMQKTITGLRLKYKDDSTALDLFKQFDHEIEMYEKYSDCYSYEFFIVQK